MAKLTLTDITAITGNETSVIAAINANNALVEAAVENTLSRDGTTPNTMTADIDLNSNKVINLDTPTNNTDAATKLYVDTIVTGAGNVPGASNPGDDNKVLVASSGAWSWTTFTASLISDAVAFMQTFLTSATAAAARINLGVEIGADVQAYDATIVVDADIGTTVQAQGATLDSLEGLSLVSGDIIYATAADTVQKLAKGSDDEVLTLASGVPSWAATTSDGAFESQLLHVREEQTSGTNGGSSSATTNHTRVLNTVKTNQITSASLSSNQISLPIGTYEIEATAPGYVVAQHKSFLYNTTDVADEVIGTSEIANSVAVQTPSVVKGRFTIAGTKVFELRHYTTAAQTANGLGVSIGTGQVEVYSEVKIWKVG